MMSWALTISADASGSTSNVQADATSASTRTSERPRTPSTNIARCHPLGCTCRSRSRRQYIGGFAGGDVASVIGTHTLSSRCTLGDGDDSTLGGVGRVIGTALDVGVRRGDCLHGVHERAWLPPTRPAL